MQSWDNYQRIKRRAEDALGVARANELYSLRLTAFLSPTSSAAVVPENEALNEALGKAAIEMWPQLKARAVQLLEQGVTEARAASKVDLEAALAEIDALEGGGS